jgi:hypothetical protein
MAMAIAAIEAAVALLPGHHARQMVLRDVGDFVAERRPIPIRPARSAAAAVYADEAARQRQGVDVVIVQREKLKARLGSELLQPACSRVD